MLSGSTISGRICTMSRIRKRGKGAPIVHPTIAHNKKDISFLVNSEYDLARGIPVPGTLPSAMLQRYADERYVEKMEKLLAAMFLIPAWVEYEPEPVVELVTRDWVIMNRALAYMELRHEFMPKVSICVSDLSEQKAHALARYATSEIHLNLPTIGKFSDYGKTWLVCHEYGHLMMNIIMGRGVAFSEFVIIEQWLPPRIFIKLDNLSYGDPIRRVEEAFAEAVALAYSDLHDGRVDGVRNAINRLINMMDDAPF